MARLKSQRKERNVVLEWGDIKQKALAIFGEGKEWEYDKESRNKGRPMPNVAHHSAQGFVAKGKNPYQKDSWEGGSAADTAGWLRNGFRAKEFLHSAAYVPQGDRPRPYWGEEDGDPDVGRILGGFDNFFLDRAPREVKPGLRIMVEFAFAAGMKNASIKNYGAWVAGLIGSLERSGYDLTVDIWVRLDNLFHSKGRSDFAIEQEEARKRNDGSYDPYKYYQGSDYDSTRDNVLIRVKRENEVSDFTDWSQIFSPTGYRHTIFMAKMMAGDKIGRLCCDGLGTTIYSNWQLDYDPEASTLKIMVNQRHYGDVDDVIRTLNKQAADLGLLPKDGGLKV